MSADERTGESIESDFSAAYGRYRPSLMLDPTLEISPDGSRVAYVDDESGQFNATIHAIEGGPRRTVTSFVDQTAQRVAWHPDGRSLIVEADAGGDENNQLFEVDIASGGVRALTNQLSSRFILASGQPFSPDGSLLAYSAASQSAPGFDTFTMDLGSGQTTCIYDKGGRTYAGHWSPDGKRLTLIQYHQGYDQAVLVVSTDGGGVTTLTPDGVPASYDLGPWLRDGSGFLVSTDEGRDFRGLAVMNAADGHLTWLDTPDWDVEAVTLSTDGRTAVWTVNVDGASQLRARNLETGIDLQTPSLPLGRVRVLCISGDGSTVAMLFSTPTRAANVVVIELAGGDIRWLTEADPRGADRIPFVEPQLIHYTSFDGTRIPAYLYRPTCPPAERVGVLIEIHGGPTWQERPIYGSGFYQFMVSLGIAVLAPNIRGSLGYGKRYQKLVYRDWGGDDLGDVAAAARYLQAQSWVDPNRIGLRGGSYGGFMVLSCIARLPELNWAAAVAMFGPTNLVTLARATPPAYRALVAEVIGDPDNDLDFLIERSPVTYASQIRTPLFVLQGANDPRVPQSESDQLVAMLRDLGTDVRYDVYPDEGHGFAKSSNQIKADSDAARFLASFLATPAEIP